MDILTFIICVLALQLVCFYVGKKTFSEQNDQSDYFLAGRTLKFFPLMMTCIATQVGGGLVLGATEEAFQYGWAVILYPMGACIGLLLLGLGVGRKLAALDVSTSAQIFEKIYGSTTLKKIASSLSIVTLFMILVAQFLASSKFMASLGVDSRLLFVVFWAIVIAYTTLGGFKAVVSTDVVQVQFFVVAFSFCAAWIFFMGGGNNVELLMSSETSSSFDWNLSKMFGWLLMPLFFMLIEQDMAQRCFSGESPKVVSKAFFWSGVFTMLICLFPISLGILARGIGLQFPEGRSVLMEMVSYSTNGYIAAFVGCAILAATVSTADSLISAITSNLSLDFDTFMTKGNEVRNSQIITVVISTAGIFLSFFFNNVVDVLIFSYELSVTCLFVPTLFAIFRKRGHWLSAGLSIGFGAVGFLCFRFAPDVILKELIVMFISLVGFGFGELIVYNTKDFKDEIVRGTQ